MKKFHRFLSRNCSDYDTYFFLEYTIISSFIQYESFGDNLFENTRVGKKPPRRMHVYISDQTMVKVIVNTIRYRYCFLTIFKVSRKFYGFFMGSLKQ